MHVLTGCETGLVAIAMALLSKVKDREAGGVNGWSGV